MSGGLSTESNCREVLVQKVMSGGFSTKRNCRGALVPNVIVGEFQYRNVGGL